MTPRGRAGGPLGIVKTVGFSVLSLVLLAGAIFLVSNELFGTPVRMTVDSCNDSGADSVDLPIHRCAGHASDVPRQSVMIIGARSSDYRHDVETHRTGAFATKDSSFDDWWAPLLLLGLGCLAGHSAITEVRRLRPLR